MALASVLAMTQPEPRTALPASPDTTPGATTAGGSIALIILAILCGALSLVLVVFGMWPAVILLLVAGGLGLAAKRRLRKLEAE